MPLDGFAFDRATRWFDHDGRLHVQLTPLTKANICPYFGHEIPNAEALGLERDKIYKLYRDPGEIQKGMHTSNNMQLLELHRVVTPGQPGKDVTVGSTGTDAAFNAPYLMNSLVVWDQIAIDGIEKNLKRQLSSSYHYQADMMPGTVGGEQYDGVMRNIRFNHVALVIDGRAGPDVLVADAMPFELQLNEEQLQMPKLVKGTSGAAMVAHGALVEFLGGKLATDQQIDLKKVLNGTTAHNWPQAKPVIVARLSTAARGKLAKDQTITGVVDVLDRLDATMAMDMDAEEDAEDEFPDDKDDDDDDDKKKKKDAEDKKAKDKAAKDKAAKDKMVKDDDDDDEDKKDKEAKDKRAKDEEDEEERKRERADDKKAMDEAIAKAKTDTVAEVKAQFAALREAEAIVKPVLGELNLAQDSADAVYQMLFTEHKVDVKGVPPVAYKAIAQQTVKAILAGQEQRRTHNTRPANDSATVTDFGKRFPNAAKVRHG